MNSLRKGCALSLSTLLSMLLLLASPPTLAEESKAKPLVETEEVTVEELLAAMSRRTGRMVLVPDETQRIIQGKKVALTNVHRYEAEQQDLLEAYTALLKAQDLTLIPIGPASAPLYLVEYLRSGSAKTRLAPVAKFVPLESLEEYRHQTVLIRTLVRLRFMEIGRAQSELRDLVSPQYGFISTVTSVNSLVITEFGPVLCAIVRMLEIMDQKEAERELVFRKVVLNHLAAEDLEPILAALLDGGDASAPRRNGSGSNGTRRRTPDPKIITEPRSNSLVIYAVKEDLDQIVELVEKLDQEVDSVRSEIHIIKMKHALASEVVEVLSDLMQGVSAGQANRRRGGGATQGVVRATGSEDAIHLVADGHTNSVLVHASESQYRDVLRLVNELDVRLPQVLIEVAVVELTEDFSSVFGIELGAIERIGNGRDRIFGATTFDNDLSLRLGGPGAGGGASLGAAGVVAGVFNGRRFAVPVLLRALATSRSGHLLSVPSILTNDNEFAEITIGQQVPFSSQTLSGNGVVQRGFGDFAEANLTLGISPSISADDYLRLGVTLTVDSFVGGFSGDPNALPPSKAVRSLETSLTVPDNATVILGGLKQVNEARDVSKVPVLGDLPLLGALFRKDSTKDIETTLYLFLSPHILNDPGFDDLEGVTRVRQSEVEQLIGDRIRLLEPASHEGHEDGSGRLMDQLPYISAYGSPTDGQER